MFLSSSGFTFMSVAWICSLLSRWSGVLSDERVESRGTAEPPLAHSALNSGQCGAKLNTIKDNCVPPRI
ncbi:hypothetical protein QQF64_006442 [Cirrhinus molitorella]|uniref:Secreted protein n=1 Tax=Cirrhinus molitorella TaxID=172907 RepID=A0ABR3MJ21_9TELE